MNLEEILVRSPVNSMARQVTSQKNVSEEDKPISTNEIVLLVTRFSRKQRLLKLVLGIKTKAQHKNTIYRFNAGFKQFRASKEPRAMAEYVICGREIQRLNYELSEMRRARRFVAELEDQNKLKG